VGSVEISRTLVKSPPELWSELQGERLEEAVGGRITESREQDRTLSWSGEGASGTVQLEPSSWGTKVTLRAEVEQQVAQLGFWARMRGTRPEPPRHDDLEKKLEDVLDSLGSAHRKPFVRDS